MCRCKAKIKEQQFEMTLVRYNGENGYYTGKFSEINYGKRRTGQEFFISLKDYQHDTENLELIS